MFEAVDENYKMAMQYKYTWNTLQNFGQFRDKRIWKNFTYFIDWMERHFKKEKFFEVMGKSYDLEDSILYRIQKTEDKKSGKDGEVNQAKKFETWLMSNVFRHVENPDKDKNPFEKYIGKVKFTKIHEKDKYEGSGTQHTIWTSPEKDENGKDKGERKSVVDIEIVVYKDEEMKIPRRYELEFGWQIEWDNMDWANISVKDPEYTEFREFKDKWADAQKKIKVPNWYLFNPDNPKVFNENHNMMKAWDETMFNFLSEQQWNERKSEKDDQGRNQYEEKGMFVVNCSQLLGIGGEAVVIRKSVEEKVGKTPEDQKDREYEALKIIPIMKHNFEDNEDKVQEMKDRVDARQKQADPENFFPPNRGPRRGNPDIGERLFNYCIYMIVNY